MTKRPDDPEVEPLHNEKRHDEKLHDEKLHDEKLHDEKRLGRVMPVADPPKATLLEGETTRVMLTDDNRVVLTERYIPTADFGFRIFVDGQHYEQIGVVPDSGARVYAPTR